jgi:hypothetical protein
MMHIVLTILLAISLACTQAPIADNNLNAIKAILAQEQQAHLEKNVSLLFGPESDSVLDINRGEVKKISPEAGKERFTNYFNAVDFIKWEDRAAPIYHFSADSTMAVVTIQKQIIVREISTSTIDTTDFAWTSVYEKKDGQWKMTVITSTQK